jgi:hypothetical protein
MSNMKLCERVRSPLRSLAQLAVLAIAAVPLVACSVDSKSTRSAPVLGTAESFAVLAGSTVTNTGPTTIAGDLGVSPGLAVTGFPPGVLLSGVVHAGDAAALQAQQDVTTSYIGLAGQACSSDLTGQDLGGLTLTPGVYCFSSSAQLTGALTLDAEGNPDSVFIFQIGSTLTTASNAEVLLINGAQSCNTYWQVGSSATLGTATDFVGNILALTSISLTTDAQVLGRALARNGAVTMDTNHVQPASCGGGQDAGPGPDNGQDAGPDNGEDDAGADDSDDAGVGDGQDAGPHDDSCVLCGGIYVDLGSDRDNCGACGNSCAWDSECVAGECSCPGTAAACGDICVELDDNPKNCGACGNVCGADQWCDGGTCTGVCEGTICDGWCTNLMTNEGACGACGVECGPAESCHGGVCECDGAICGATCVDLDTSATDCGSCGNVCGGDECCTAGACVPL